MNATDTTIEPWSPYREDVWPRSGGRVLLGEALTTYTVLMRGLPADEIAAAFDDDGDARTRAYVLSSIRLLGKLLVEDRLKAWARPIGGGQAVEMPADLWELDDFTHRFATCALDMRRPFDASSPPTHRIFIGDEDHKAIFDGCCEGVPRPIMKKERATSTEMEPGPDLAVPPPVPVGIIDRHIRMPEIERLTGMAKQTIYKRIAEGRFPQQINPGSRPASWYESEVAAWLANPR
ncbi:MAG: AlpA family phage regulatory protein [Sphingomonas sp.]|uniref:helix-turn-helix transcriptional regulator n=1 Tax=Sphingomonas sp. TaxID=28214 RepID=UPI0025EF80D4|nr:AlpA family phage regulatory protein [Sphingomonas sp.]MBY0284598.1 AlpA family phage regulatory protein [Sphingomonas sp.]